MMDHPSAEEALQELEPLVGEWRLTATPARGAPWPGGEGRATFEWHDGQIRGRQQDDRRPLGEGRGRHQLRDRLRLHLHPRRV